MRTSSSGFLHLHLTWIKQKHHSAFYTLLQIRTTGSWCCKDRKRIAQNRVHFVISSITTTGHFFSRVVIENTVASRVFITLFYITRSKRSNVPFIFNGINRLRYVFALVKTTIYRIYLIKWRPRINAAPNQMNAAFIRNSVQLDIYTIQPITTLSQQKSERLELETSSCFTYYLQMIYHNCCWNKGSIGNTKNFITQRSIK